MTNEPLRTYVYHGAMLILSSMAIVINLATVCVILFKRALRKRQNIFTFNLALADCLSNVTLFLNNTFDFPGVLLRRENLHWIIPVFTSGLLISILSTLAIAFERLIVLRFDALGRHRIVTANRSIALCIIVWITIPSMYLILHRFARESSYFLLFVISPCAIIASLVITGICYLLIYKKISTISDKVGLNDAALRHRAESSKKVLVTFALVVASTSACWIIMCSVLLVEVFGNSEITEMLWFRIISDVGSTLVCLNGILNPIIIWLRLTQFRRELNACCGSPMCRSRGLETENSSVVQSESNNTNKVTISSVNLGMEDIEK